MNEQPICGGVHYEETVKLLRRKNPDYITVIDHLKDGAYELDLYCISMLYDRFFDLDDDAFEDIYEMLGFLAWGVEHGFWLSLYQSADLIEELQKSVFAGRTHFEMFHDPVALIDAAVRNFRKVPFKISSLSKEDIKKKEFLLTIKG